MADIDTLESRRLARARRLGIQIRALKQQQSDLLAEAVIDASAEIKKIDNYSDDDKMRLRLMNTWPNCAERDVLLRVLDQHGRSSTYGLAF